MPTETQLQSANPRGRPKKPPLGIPLWGWAAAAAIGIIIGYFLLKKKSPTGDSSSSNQTTPLPFGDSGGAGGSGGPSLADILAAMGVSKTPGQSTVPTPSTPDNPNEPDTTTVPSTIPAAVAPPYIAPSSFTPAPDNPNIDAVTGISSFASSFSAQTDSSLSQMPASSFDTSGTIQGSTMADAATIEQPQTQMVWTDATGHVVNAKGARVGGMPADVG